MSQYNSAFIRKDEFTEKLIIIMSNGASTDRLYLEPDDFLMLAEKMNEYIKNNKL